MSSLYGGPSIDASYQVSVHLTKGFQRRRLKCEVNGRRTPSDGKSLLPLKLFIERTIKDVHYTLPIMIFPNTVICHVLDTPSIVNCEFLCWSQLLIHY